MINVQKKSTFVLTQECHCASVATAALTGGIGWRQTGQVPRTRSRRASGNRTPESPSTCSPPAGQGRSHTLCRRHRSQSIASRDAGATRQPSPEEEVEDDPNIGEVAAAAAPATGQHHQCTHNNRHDQYGQWFALDTFANCK
uniref:Uncharacterized protein n=1 Tax=Oryza punctata TaxID=4537 RepID=A0A0E0KED4_ORYPU